MSERDVIDRSSSPVTTSSLTDDLRALGVEPGTSLLVHASLSQLGFVVGGPRAVVEALFAAVGEGGTVVMPAHSTDLTDPATWSNPPVPDEWVPVIRAEMPAYDATLTPTRDMGAIPEYFRRLPDARRSDSPTVSAAAVGEHAAFVTTGHELANGLGESSPQARVYDLDGSILLLGVTHANNTSLHLAEHRSAPPNAATLPWSSPVIVDGVRQWVTAPNLDDDPSDFARIGEAFAATGHERVGPIGAGTGRLMRSRDVVDFAVDWMNAHRTWVTRNDD